MDLHLFLETEGNIVILWKLPPLAGKIILCERAETHTENGP